MRRAGKQSTARSLRKLGEDKFNAQAVTWVLCARIVDDRVNGWVPTGKKHAPQVPRSAWACWYKREPDLEIVPHTLSLRENGEYDFFDQVIPPSEEGMYFTHWLGGGWIRGWTPVTGGAMHLFSREPLTYERLTHWDPDLPSRIPPGSTAANDRDTLVSDVLSHIASQILSQAPRSG